MNRPFKFRAWDLKRKTWAIWDDVAVCPASPQEKYSDDRVLTMTEDGWIDENEDEEHCFQLFTGIEDINGVEIYEGDIIEETWRENQPYSYSPDEFIERSDRFNVVYVAPSFNFPKRNGDQVCIENYKIKVIGNIFENPNLA